MFLAIGSLLRYNESKGSEFMADPNVQDRNTRFPDPPLGVYGGSDRTVMEIKENSVVLREDISGSMWYQQYEMRFEELTDVYFKASANWRYGYLSVRGRFNRWTPIPTNAREAMWDSMSIRFWKIGRAS